jgi:hypothetical protein
MRERAGGWGGHPSPKGHWIDRVCSKQTERSLDRSCRRQFLFYSSQGDARLISWSRRRGFESGDPLACSGRGFDCSGYSHERVNTPIVYTWECITPCTPLDRAQAQPKPRSGLSGLGTCAALHAPGPARARPGTSGIPGTCVNGLRVHEREAGSGRDFGSCGDFDSSLD